MDSLSTPSESGVSQEWKPLISTRLFYVGLGLYAVSFFMTAVRGGSGSISGWRCAWASLFSWAVLPDSRMTPLLAAGLRLSGFSGLINPVAIAYTVLRTLDRSAKIRRVLVAVLLV